MTDEQINATIAEACEWTDFLVHPEFGLMGVEPSTHGLRTAVPWYVYDLNAMHEAEKMLTVEQKETIYQDELDTVTTRGRRGLTVGLACYLALHATARQRAEAFLRTLGKWEDSK